MAIEYICNNCGKKFKIREYMRLEMIYVPDDRSKEILIPKGRKCDSCGKEINIDDKTVKM